MSSVFFINMLRLTKGQTVSICLEYARINNAREVIPAALGRSLTTNVYFLTIVCLSTRYCYIKYLIGRFQLILDTSQNGYSSLNAALLVNIARKYTGHISKFKLDHSQQNKMVRKLDEDTITSLSMLLFFCLCKKQSLHGHKCIVFLHSEPITVQWCGYSVVKSYKGLLKSYYWST